MRGRGDPLFLSALHCECFAADFACIILSSALHPLWKLSPGLQELHFTKQGSDLLNICIIFPRWHTKYFRMWTFDLFVIPQKKKGCLCCEALGDLGKSKVTLIILSFLIHLPHTVSNPARFGIKSWSQVPDPVSSFQYEGYMISHRFRPGWCQSNGNKHSSLSEEIVFSILI